MGYFEFNDIGRKAKKFQAAAKEFGEQVLRPAGEELDRLKDPADVIAKQSRLWDVFKQSRELGFHKFLVARAFGGYLGKVPQSAAGLVTEQMGYWDSGLAISLEVSNMPFAFAILSESAEVRDWARQYCEDKDANMIGCWAITEPDHGTDWVLGTTEEGSNPKTTPNLKAVKKGNEYILNGWKAAWVSNGTIATHAVLHVSLDPSQGMHGSGLAMCPLDLPGISKGKPLNKIGQRALNQGEIIFEDVVLPEKYMLLKIPGLFKGNAFGKGFLGVANSQMGVTFCGLSRAILDETVKYAKENMLAGKPLLEHQEVRTRLFYMFAQVEAARLLAHNVVGYMDPGGWNPIMSAISSLYLSARSSFWVAGKSLSWVQDWYDKNKDNPKVVNFFEKRAQRPQEEGGFMDWTKYGIAAKITSTETAYRVAGDAIQIFGEDGNSIDQPVEKMFRDARASMIEDGANESLALAASENLLA